MVRFCGEKYAILLSAFLFLLPPIAFAESVNPKDLGRKIEESIFIFSDEKYSIETKHCLVRITRKNTDCEHSDAVSEVETSIFFDEIDHLQLLGSRKEYRIIDFLKSKNRSKSKVIYTKCDGKRVVSYDDGEFSILVKGDLDRNLMNSLESIRRDCAK